MLKFKMNFKPCILWFTGLSGSGKSFISEEVYKKLKKLGINKLKVIDGDIFRKKINNFSYNKLARNKVGLKKLALANKFKKKNYIVLVSGVASSRAWRKKIKKLNKYLIEIYIKCPLYICKKRDYKNIYISSKNFQKYQEGNSRDLIIKSNLLSKNEATIKIINFLKKQNSLTH